MNQHPLRKYWQFIPLIFSFILLISLSGCDDSEEGGSAPALFTFKDNLAVQFQTQVPVSIDIYNNAISSIELLINDSLMKKWDAPKKKLDFKINTSELGIGAKRLDLLITYENGKTYTDNRIIRVLSDVVPENWTLSILNSFPHNKSNFTQGLEFNNGQLYESTGQQGASKVAKIELSTGNDILQIGLDASHFGEGITILGDTLYQITWTTGRCFLYDKNTLQPFQKDFNFPGQGWGLCNDGKSIIMSDGSERITFRNPKTFAIERTIEVYTNSDAVTNLNELEYIDGFIYANIWMTNKIIVIDPAFGKVIAVMDGAELVKKGRGAYGEAFNGIAYNRQSNSLFLTGKRWEKLFEVAVNKPNV